MQTLTLYLFVMPFFLNLLQEWLHLPGLIKYTVDVAWVAVILRMLSVRTQVIYKKTLPILVLLILYVLYVSVAYLCQYQSAFYFLWGVRNNLRYYAAFFAFVYMIDRDDLKLCLKLVDVLFAVHVVLSLFQFFVLGYKWDYLGGIFGNQVGCNANSLILLVVSCTKSLLMYMHGKEGLLTSVLVCGASLVVAAMAELKFFFVLCMIILVVAAMITKFSWKKILLIAGVTFCISLAGSIFTIIWGEDAALNVDRIVELITSKGYSSEKDLGRFTAIPILSRTILIQIPQKLFGLGLGNCDTSSFAICNTPFYQAHSYLNYNWFSSAFTFIETGYVGLLFTISFYVIVGVCALRMKRMGVENELYADFAIVMSVACVALFFYNSSLRTDIAYVVYFVLALPFMSGFSESVSQRQGHL